MSSPDTTTGLLLFFSSLLGVEYLRSRRQHLHYVDCYWQERKGRNRVEREMRKISDIQLNAGGVSEGASGGVREHGAFFVQPIAKVEGCYKQVSHATASLTHWCTHSLLPLFCY